MVKCIVKKLQINVYNIEEIKFYKNKLNIN